MLSILAKSMGLATHLSSEEHQPPSHASMLREHERRKGEELRHYLAHQRRFVR